MTTLREASGGNMRQFCSLDMADRLIRIEQQVSASFNKIVPYKETNYYKSLTSNQKKDLDNFVRRKKRNRILALFFMLIPLAGLFVLGKGLTGHTIFDNSSESFFIQASLSAISLIASFLLLSSLVSKLIKDAKCKRYTSVIDNWIDSRYSTKRHKKVFK